MDALKSLAFYKALVAGLAVLLALEGALSAVLLLRSWRELRHYSQLQADTAQQLESQKLQLLSQQTYLDKLRDDPAFLEHVVRERLGYARPDELIYRFDVDPLTATLPGSTPSLAPQPPAKTPAPTISPTARTQTLAPPTRPISAHATAASTPQARAAIARH